jgi:hypothetical protein
MRASIKKSIAVSVAVMTLGFGIFAAAPPAGSIPDAITHFTAAFSAARSVWASWAAWSPRNTATPAVVVAPTIAGATISLAASSLRAIESSARPISMPAARSIPRFEVSPLSAEPL